jgi:hypothetical protein
LTAILAGVAGALVGALAALVLASRTWPDRWLRALPRGDLSRADYFAVFGMGLGPRDARGKPTAGASNEALADWLLANNPRRKPTIVQEGVYLALLAREKLDRKLKLSAWVLRLPHDDGVSVDTAGATLQCWALAAARGLSRPVVVAHDLQQQRMAWLFDRIYTSDRVVIPELPAIPFDPASTQHWGTRSRPNWVLWELLLARPSMGRYRGSLLLGLATLATAALVGLSTFGLVWAFVK